MAILSTDSEIRRLLDSVRSVAVVGMSPRPARHSHSVARWIIANTDWTVWFVNPHHSEILGRRSYRSLADLPEAPDLVDVFRNRHELGHVADDAVAAGARSLWFQLDLVDEDAAGRAAEAGLDVVQDRCLKVELARLADAEDEAVAESPAVADAVAPVGAALSLHDLLDEYDVALAHTDRLWHDLTADELSWRPHADASAIGWHLGHQAATAHFLVRNLLAAEPLLDPELDALMDSATPEPARGTLPEPARLADYRRRVAERVRLRVGDVARGDVGAPTQLREVAANVMRSIVNHEYQHDKWIAEVRTDELGRAPVPIPRSPRLVVLDGYCVVRSDPSTAGDS